MDRTERLPKVQFLLNINEGKRASLEQKMFKDLVLGAGGGLGGLGDALGAAGGLGGIMDAFAGMYVCECMCVCRNDIFFVLMYVCMYVRMYVYFNEWSTYVCMHVCMYV